MRNMSQGEVQSLIDAGFTRQELEAVINAVQFAAVLAAAGEGERVGGIQLPAAKAAVLLKILGAMKDETDA